ncbi:DUF3040 domain-containing protein [Salinibacterium sp. dk2585]|uniref:DUF3040 domain-containing protein n=1 Tax=unclassified Salinibacterium TaxID=2632331 RepID=UPI0011C252EB|nr:MULTISPECIES: DUF3040 domain-containing protein [unclassified Salinibacterium]MBF0671244.1 DUF3040 domain-containing protein [Salinibacterium sp.]QEE61109.1 DUF3040 domain-containing protein [Salinibacterium sp. dk2585]TXK53052.1 DUF3040 domain-containing protein [Salinibacterium sp. dk5596]
MPLSEREQRLLDEMERSLYQNDADFVSTVSQRRGAPNYRLLVGGVLIALAGVAAIVVGVVIKQPLVGVLGFIVVFGGALLAISSPRRSDSPVSPVAGPSRGKSHAGFMDRMNERWERRQGER